MYSGGESVFHMLGLCLCDFIRTYIFLVFYRFSHINDFSAS